MINPLSPVPRAVVYNSLAISGNGAISCASYTSEVWTTGYPAVPTQRVKLSKLCKFLQIDYYYYYCNIILTYTEMQVYCNS